MRKPEGNSTVKKELWGTKGPQVNEGPQGAVAERGGKKIVKKFSRNVGREWKRGRESGGSELARWSQYNWMIGSFNSSSMYEDREKAGSEKPKKRGSFPNPTPNPKSKKKRRHSKTRKRGHEKTVKGDMKATCKGKVKDLWGKSKLERTVEIGGRELDKGEKAKGLRGLSLWLGGEGISIRGILGGR